MRSAWAFECTLMRAMVVLACFNATNLNRGFVQVSDRAPSRRRQPTLAPLGRSRHFDWIQVWLPYGRTDQRRRHTRWRRREQLHLLRCSPLYTLYKRDSRSVSFFGATANNLRWSRRVLQFPAPMCIDQAWTENRWHITQPTSVYKSWAQVIHVLIQFVESQKPVSSD